MKYSCTHTRVSLCKYYVWNYRTEDSHQRELRFAEASSNPPHGPSVFSEPSQVVSFAELRGDTPTESVLLSSSRTQQQQQQHEPVQTVGSSVSVAALNLRSSTDLHIQKVSLIRPASDK